MTQRFLAKPEPTKIIVHDHHPVRVFDRHPMMFPGVFFMTISVGAVPRAYLYLIRPSPRPSPSPLPSRPRSGRIAAGQPELAAGRKRKPLPADYT